MRAKNKACKENGSLLVEAMLSVVILSVGLTLIIQSMTMSLRTSTYTMDYSLGMIVVDNKMFDVLKDGFIARGIKKEENIIFNNKEYKGLLETKGSIDFEGLNEVIFELEWRSGRRRNKLLTSTYLLDLTNEKK